MTADIDSRKQRDSALVRVVRVRRLSDGRTNGCLALAFAMSAVGIVVLSFGGTLSPFGLCMVLVLIKAFGKLHVPQSLARIIAFFSPLLFSVYLVHSNAQFGFRVIADVERVLSGSPFSPSATLIYVSVSLFVFLASLTLDMPRRLFAYGFRSLSAR